MPERTEAQQSRIRELEAERDEFLEQRNEYIGFEEKARSERDALAAVIEKVREAADRHVGLPSGEVLAILDATPSDVLREHDTEVWDAAKGAVERIHPRCTEECEMCAELDDWLRILDEQNPYRTEKPEDAR